jgi:drug/metabolite transporter (DMT)-like permease
MIAIGCGMATALLWGCSMALLSRSTRAVGSQQALAYVMLISLPIAAALALGAGVPRHSGHHGPEWALLAGCASSVGASLTYRALQLGTVGVVAPIVSTEGALAAVYSVLLFGEHLTFGVAMALGIIVVGVVSVTLRGSAADVQLRPSVYALAAAATFGIGLISSSRASMAVGPLWTALTARVIGATAIALPFVLRGTLRRPGRIVWLLAFSAIAELGGFVSFMIGSEHDLAIAAVLASQAAAVAVLVSRALFGERLRARHAAGVAAILVGVAALAAVRA